MITELKNRILNGGDITAQEALALVELLPAQAQQLRDAAAEITDAFAPKQFDSCSIVNARSGLCGEDCKWCAQATRYATGVATYPLIAREDCLQAAALNRAKGIRRFSLVTSGRKMSGKELAAACDYYRTLQAEGGLHLCASMGLLSKEELQQLKDAGVNRYHCNLEAAPEVFGSLCTTHSIEDKIRTIRYAQELGMEVCSGGIIGMGEDMKGRVALALELRRIDPVSIPINILCPIPGTPLANQPLIEEDEVLDCVALFRFIHPRVTLRFAGGRARMSAQATLEALRIGINGCIMGDMLTTIGATIDQDIALINQSRYDF